MRGFAAVYDGRPIPAAVGRSHCLEKLLSLRPAGGTYSFGSFGSGGGAGGFSDFLFFGGSAANWSRFFPGPAGSFLRSTCFGGGSYFWITSKPIGIFKSRWASNPHGVFGASSIARFSSRSASAASFREAAPVASLRDGLKYQWLVFFSMSPDPSCLSCAQAELYSRARSFNARIRPSVRL